MAVLQINGVTVKSPKEMTWSLQDLSSEDSGRTLDGVMHKDRVAQKRKLSCKWGTMDVSESSTLLQAVNALIEFPVTYLDVMTGTYITKIFYVGDRTAPKMIETATSQKVESVAFDFIEV